LRLLRRHDDCWVVIERVDGERHGSIHALVLDRGALRDTKRTSGM
jgi:hypothetical protein